MTNDRHAHFSMLHDAHPAAVAAHIAGHVEQASATSFTATECQKPATARAVRRRLGPSWKVSHGGEYLIGVRLDTYARTPRGDGLFQRVTWAYETGEAWRDLWKFQRRWVHRTAGREVLFIAAHFASGVENGDRYRTDNPRGVRANRRGKRRIRAMVDRLDKTRPDVEVVLGSDDNTDALRAPWRKRDRRNTGMRSVWDDGLPRRGSHGGPRNNIRLIDNVRSTARTTDGRVHEHGPSDHRAVSSRLQIPTKPGRTAA